MTATAKKVVKKAAKPAAKNSGSEESREEGREAAAKKAVKKAVKKTGCKKTCGEESCQKGSGQKVTSINNDNLKSRPTQVACSLSFSAIPLSPARRFYADPPN